MKDKPAIADVALIAPEAGEFLEIGEGGFKVVYRARVKGVIEAVKLVRIPSSEKDETVRDENLRRVDREIRILGDCQTPFLVKLGGILPRLCTIATEAYVLYSEEFLPGDSLRDLIVKQYRPELKELLTVGTSLLGAVKELAGKGVIHRDIKPENVMKTTLENRPFVLLDLGIAFQMGGTPITRDSAAVPGTLYYIAPEMLGPSFRNNLDYRADLYTIGLTLYEFASGANPFKQPSDPQHTTLYRIKTLIPKPLRQHRGDLPESFCDLVDQLMKKLPALRPSNISAILKRLEEPR